MSDIVKLKVINNENKQGIEDEMRIKILEVIDQFAGRMTVVSALGVLRIVESDFMNGHGL